MRTSQILGVVASSSLLLGFLAGAPVAAETPDESRSVTSPTITGTPGLRLLPRAPQVIQGTPEQLLQQIPVTEPLTVGYRAGLFLTPAEMKKKDRRGCNYRNQMLIKLATKKPRVGAGCKLSGGEWLVDFGLKKVRKASEVQLGRLFPDKFVYAQGAYGWTSDQRRAYAMSTATDAKQVRSQTKGLFSEDNVQPLSQNSFRVIVKINNVLNTPKPPSEIELELAALQKANPALYASWTVATLLNAKAWGISFNLGVHQIGQRTIQQCSNSNSLRYGTEVIQMRSPELAKPVSDTSQILNLCSNTYSIVNQAAKNNIVPVPEFASQVPPTNDTVLNTYGTPQGDPIDRFLFGIHAPADWVSDETSGFSGPIKEATIPNVPVGYLRLWDTETTWADIEPSKGDFRWRKLDKQIEMAQILDARVMLVLGQTPAWAGDGNPWSNPTNISDWRNYVKTVACRYGPSITSYEVWNEANLQTFWKGTPAEMAALTKEAFEAIRDCNPSAQVVAANTTSRATGSFGTFYPAYLEELKKLGWPVDAYSVHSYPTASGGADDRIKGIGQFRTMLALAGAPQTRVFDTEINYGLAGLSENKVDLTGQTAMTLMSRTYIDSARYGFGSTFWFVWTANPDSKFGIQFTRQASAERQAWNITYDWLVGAQYQRCFVTESEIVVCQFNKGPNNFSIVWKGDVGDSSSETPAGYFSGLGSQVCDLFGQCQQVTPTSKTIVGPMPRRIDGPPSGSGPSTAPPVEEESLSGRLTPPRIVNVPTVEYTTANTETVSVSWFPEVEADSLPATGYEYEIRFCGKKQEDCPTVVRRGSVASSVTSVEARVNEGPGIYTFRVRATNRDLVSTWSETPFLVRSTRALPPSGVRAKITDDGKVSVDWDAPRVADGKVDFYEVEMTSIDPAQRWGSVKFSTASATDTKKPTPRSITMSLKELNLGDTSTFRFRVRTVLKGQDSETQKGGLRSIFETSNELTLRQDLPIPSASSAQVDATGLANVSPAEGPAPYPWQIRVSPDLGATWVLVTERSQVTGFTEPTSNGQFGDETVFVNLSAVGAANYETALIQVRYVNSTLTSASPWVMATQWTLDNAAIQVAIDQGKPLGIFTPDAKPTVVLRTKRENGVVVSYFGFN